MCLMVRYPPFILVNNLIMFLCQQVSGDRGMGKRQIYNVNLVIPLLCSLSLK